MKKLFIVSALLAASATANAAVVDVTLVSAELGSPQGGLSTLVQLAVPTFQYDDVTGELSSSGVLSLRGQIAPPTVLFTHNIADLNIVGGSAAGTAAYTCVEGNFGGIVGASICGNYTHGGNFIDESTVSYGPGLAFSRTMGGDDVVSGDQQSIAAYNLILASYTGAGGTLVLQDAAFSNTNGIRLTFDVAEATVVPVPAAVWLFGSALGLMGLVRRRLAA